MKNFKQFKRSCPIFIMMISMVFFSCKKTIEIEVPINESVANKVFTSEASANSALNGLYTTFLNRFDSSEILLSSLSADELTTNLTTYLDFNINILKSDNSFIAIQWNNFYNLIYQSNSIIEGTQNSKYLSLAVKNQLIGEAKFMRAFVHFQLLNFYGDVPLITTTDVKVTSISSKTPVNQIYQQIIADLKDAQYLLKEAYASADRARVNKSTVTAFLARVYLYIEDYPNAELQSTNLIDNLNTYQLESLDKTFLKSSKETIFQIANNNSYTGISGSLIPSSFASKVNYSYTGDFENAIEIDDQRKSSWMKKITIGGVSYLYPYKYKKLSSTLGLQPEYLVVFRLAEQFLIRAEARTQLEKNLRGAREDLNAIRNRAGLIDSQKDSKTELLDAIARERRIELNTEFGHRWFDLKRTRRVDATLKIAKPNWQSSAALYPIPVAELINNPNLTQNKGY